LARSKVIDGPLSTLLSALSFFGALLFALCVSAEAQQAGKLYRVGTLSSGAPSGRAEIWQAFRQGLRERGYVEGKNITLEQRWNAGKGRERMDALANELVRLKVDVIVTEATSAALAAKRTTSTIPIVMASQSDPVGTGLVASLAKPGGNVTGLSSMNVELSGKRLEVLKDAFPNLSRVVFLRPVQSPSLQAGGAERAARALGVQFQIVESRPEEFEAAFLTMAKTRAEGLTLSSPNFFAHRTRLVELAAKARLPAIYPEWEYVEAGGLMSYGIVREELYYRRAAYYVDKILKGAKAADLPVEQPTKFELVINLKTAKALGLAIPPQMLMDADRVIK
jgi:putative ABC transport system substrate-binding protein